MEFDDAVTPSTSLNLPISIWETFIDDYKRLFARVNMRLVSVYRRFENDMFIDNQGIVKIEAIVVARELRL